MKVRKNKYKMRAECSLDIGKFLMNVGVISLSMAGMEIEGVIIPDVEATFTSTMPLDELRLEIAKIEDGHVMLESLNLANKYTGERYFGH